MSELPPVCILAGGLGSRLGERVRATPKPLLEVAGQPFIVHQLRLLASNGFRHVVLCVGYLGEQIEDALGSQLFGIEITYSYDEPGLDGTLGAIRRARPLLPDHFLILYGDTYLRLDYRRAYNFWRASGLLGLMTILRNEGRWGQSNVEYAGDRVLRHDKVTTTPVMKWIDFGLGGLVAEALDLVEDTATDLSALYGHLASIRQLSGFEVRDRFYEIGSPEALAEADAFLQTIIGR